MHHHVLGEGDVLDLHGDGGEGPLETASGEELPARKLQPNVAFHGTRPPLWLSLGVSSRPERPYQTNPTSTLRRRFHGLLEDYHRVLGPDHPDTLATRGNLPPPERPVSRPNACNDKSRQRS